MDVLNIGRVLHRKHPHRVGRLKVELSDESQVRRFLDETVEVYGDQDNREFCECASSEACSAPAVYLRRS